MPRARAHAFAGEGEKAVGRGALPLRIARRKMQPDIAVGERAENGVDQRMQRDVGVGMAGHAARMRDANAAEHDMIAIGESMDVETVAGAYVGEAARCASFGAGKIVIGGHLHVAGFALEHADAMAGPFGERGVVGEILKPGLGSAPMRLEDEIESESLRRLHDAKPAAVERFGDTAVGVDRFFTVSAMAMPGTAAPVALAGGDGAVDQRAGQKRPRRVVDEHEVGRARRQRLKPGAHRSLPRGAAGNRRQQICQSPRSPRDKDLRRRGWITGCTAPTCG